MLRLLLITLLLRFRHIRLLIDALRLRLRLADYCATIFAIYHATFDFSYAT